MSTSWFVRANSQNVTRNDAIPEGVPATFTTHDQGYVLAEDDKLSTCSTHQTFNDSIDGVEVLGAPPPKNFVEWNSRWSGRIVEDNRFKRLMIALIMINSIILGVATFDFVTENEEVKRLVDVVEFLFLIIFSGEVVLQAIHHKVNFLSDGWLLFDTIVVAVAWFMPSLMVLRAFRIMRTLRLATKIQPLKNVANGLLRAVPKMLSVTFLLSILLYVFSVLFTSLYKDLYRDGFTSEDYFSRIDLTCFTLFQIMTLDSWSQVTKEVMEAHPWAWVPFISFVMMATFVLANLLIAVLCEAMLNVQHEKRDGKRVEEEKHESEPSQEVAHHIARLEEKIDDLTLKLDLILRSKDAMETDQGEVSLE